jgi:RNA polymerase sigma factor (sigma-70 family)
MLTHSNSPMGRCGDFLSSDEILEKIAPENARSRHYKGRTMSTSVLNNVVVSDAPVLGDAELVKRFIVARDQAAITELVHRHGPVVLGVCRRVLQDRNDIDDAFQATFLVFVRDVKRLRKRTSLASWLYGVAYRLSQRIVRTKRQRRETVLTDTFLVDDNTFEKMADRHDQRLLDDELNSLPERYRQPLVLRYLTGKSTDEVASELGTTVGAVEGLLKRGKNELRRRLLGRGVTLVRRGITLGAVLTSVEASQHAVDAATIGPLIDSTIHASLAWKPGSTTPTIDPISARAVELAGKEIIAMATTKSTIAVGLTLGGLIAGIGGPGLMGGSPKGSVEAAGINTVLPIVRAAGEQAEMAIATTPNAANDTAATDAKADKNPENSDSKLVKRLPPSDESKNATVRERWDLQIITPKRQKIETALADDVEVDLQMPLKDALHYIEQEFKIRIVVDKLALDDEGISTENDVSLNIAGVSLKSALKLILEPLKLDYIVKNEYLLITTQTVADRTMETRVYKAIPYRHNKLDGLARMITTVVAPTDWNPISFANPAIAQRTRVGDFVIKSSDSSDAAVASKPGNPQKQLPDDSAKPLHGGPGDGSGPSDFLCSIHVEGDTLVIRATQRIHNEISELLDQLAQRDQRQAPQQKPQEATSDAPQGF